MCKLDAGNRDHGIDERLEASHGSAPLLDRPMILFDDVVQILDLTNLDGRLAFGIHCMKRGQVGTAFVDGHRFGRSVLTDCLVEEAPGGNLVPLGSEQKIGFCRSKARWASKRDCYV